ncbi:MAG: carbohydrate kinase family protein [Acidobacteriota bacterium]|nr:MAG: carbohydrate kinase family protein [Acidobacteriota bacterium]
MKARNLDVLCVSDMCVDLVMWGNVRPRFGQVEQLVEDYLVELGGSANIFACQFAKLGGRAGVVGHVGHDAFGELSLKRLSECGVDTSLVKISEELKTGLGIALTEPDDRAILTVLGTIDATAPEELTPEVAGSCRHWHIASYFLLNSLRETWLDWLKFCRQKGVTTSLDTNWDPAGLWHGILDLLPWVDVFLPNEQEALALTGEESAESAGKRLAEYGPIVVIKCGRRGALAFHGSERWNYKIEETIEPADSVGAGDNFDAGFLRGWLLGYDVEACLHLGHRCAASSLRDTGGISGQLREIIA